MAAETSVYKLKKPSGEDFYNIEDFNGNADKIEAALIKKPDKPLSSKAGNFPALDSSGNLTDSGKSPSSFLAAETTAVQIGGDPAGSAAAVSSSLSTHANNTTAHCSSADKSKIAKAVISDSAADIVISASKPAAVQGRIWIKI